MKHESALYIVATPIGNLSDITPRAVETLKNVTIIAAEDTRHSARLLSHCGIETPMMSYHDHGGQAQVERVIQRLRNGESVALISDAGTPLISDPGFRLVHLVRQAGFSVVPIPGACALIAAVSASGIASDRFIFEGFPPHKQGARVECFKLMAEESRSIVYYESPHRIEAALADLETVFGAERTIVMARELTKSFETFLSGTIKEVREVVANDPNQRRGEIVLVVSGREIKQSVEISEEGRRTLQILLEELPLKQAAALTAKITGDKKNKLYQWAVSEAKK